MKFEKFVLNIILHICSLLLPFFKSKQNRVVFISLTSARLEGDMALIAEKLAVYDEVDVKYILFKYQHTPLSSLCYVWNCIRQFFAVNTARVVVINDNNYVISHFKKRDVIVIQIWHACGAIKKFGNEVPRKYPIRNYDYVIAASAVWKDIYARSFHVHPDRVLPLGIARTDRLLDREFMRRAKQEMYQKYPQLQGAYVVLYAPTFRGNIIDGMSYVPLDVDAVVRHLPQDVIFMYKMHPLLGDVILGKDERVLNVNKEDLYALFSVTDCLISDYSSVLFDFSLLGKKELYYVPDIQQYKVSIGLNVSFDDLPGTLCYTEEELSKELLGREVGIEQEAMQQFCRSYFKYQDGKSAERIAAFIRKQLS